MIWKGRPLSFLPMLAGSIEQLAAEPRRKQQRQTSTGSRIGHVGLFGPLDPEYYIASRQIITELTAESTVRAIVMLVNSPGGTVEGCEELAEVVRRAAAVKPVHVIAEGYLCSAAYHACCQATTIMCSPSCIVGSIGTIGILIDDSEMFRQLGIKVLPIATGINKAAGMPGVPVAAEHVAMVQGLVDLAQLRFESAIERGRKLKPEQLRAVTDGSAWTAGRAERLKLIDGVALPEDRYAQIEREYPAEPYAALTGRAAAEKFEQLALAACKLETDDDIDFVPESVFTKLRAEHPILAAATNKFNSERRTYGRRYK